MQKASSVHTSVSPNINIIDVSGYGNNCGLYALTLAVKIQIEKKSAEKAKLNLPKFFDRIEKQCLTSVTEDTEKTGTLLRAEIGTSLKENILFKERRQENFVQCCVNYLANQDLKALAVDMEIAINSNIPFLTNLLNNWLQLLPFIRKGYDNYEAKLKQHSLINSEVESYTTSLKYFLKELGDGNFNDEFIKLFNPYFTKINNPLEKFILLYKLFWAAWCQIKGTDAIAEIRLQCKTSFENWSKKIMFQLYEIHNSEKLSLALGCLAFLTEAKFDIDGNITNKINIEAVEVTASSLFAYLHVNNDWDNIYNRYCVGLENSDVQLSADELGVLAQRWQVNLTILFNNGEQYQTPPSKYASSLNVVLYNPQKNHWQVVNTVPIAQLDIHDIQSQLILQLTKSKSEISFNELIKSVKTVEPIAAGEEYNKYPKLADALKGPIYQQLYAANLLFSRFSLEVDPNNKDFDIKVEDVDSGVGFDDIKFFHKSNGKITHTFSYQIKHCADENNNLYQKGMFDTKTGYGKEVMLYKYFDAWIINYRNKQNSSIYIATNHKLDPNDNTLIQCFTTDKKTAMTSFATCFTTGEDFPNTNVKNYYEDFIQSIKLYADLFAASRETPTPQKTSTPTKSGTPTKTRAPKPQLKKDFDHQEANNLIHDFFKDIKFEFNRPAKNGLEKLLKEKICKHFNIQNDAIYYALFHEMLFWLTDKNISHNLQTASQFFDDNYKKSVTIPKLLGITQENLRKYNSSIPSPKVDLNQRITSIQKHISDLLNNKHTHLMLVQGEKGAGKSSLLSECFMGEFGKQFRQGQYIYLNADSLNNEEYLTVINLDIIKLVIIDHFDFIIHNQLIVYLHNIRKKTILISHEDIHVKLDEKQILYLQHTVPILSTDELHQYVKSNALIQKVIHFAGNQYQIADILKYNNWAIAEHIRNLATLRTITFKQSMPSTSLDDLYIPPLIEKKLPTYELFEFLISHEKSIIVQIENKLINHAIDHVKKAFKSDNPKIKNIPKFETLVINNMMLDKITEIKSNATALELLKIFNPAIRTIEAYYFIKISDITMNEKFINCIKVLLTGKNIVIFVQQMSINEKLIPDAVIIEHVPTSNSIMECKIINSNINKDLLPQGNCFEPYSYNNLMNQFDNNQSFKILLSANGGQGKTTLLQKILRDRIIGQTTRFSWVILIRLGLVARFELKKSIPDGTDLLLFIIEQQLYTNGQIITEAEKLILKKDLELGNVLLLLDGLDEILPDHFKENRLFLCLFNYTSFLLATRHNEIIPFEPNLKIELRDFDKTRVRSYLKEREVNIDFNLLFKHELFNIISVPLHCYLFAEIWLPGMNLNSLNQYQLFNLFILKKLERHLERNITIDAVKKIPLAKKLQFSQLYLDTLATLAAEQMGLITTDALNSLNKFIIDDLLAMEIIEKLPDHNNEKVKIRFKHKRFQEYFVAYYLIQGLLKNRQHQQYNFSCEMIIKLRYQTRFKMIFEFMSNIVADDQALLLGSTQGLLTFWKLLLMPPIDIIGIKHNELITACLKRYKAKKFPQELSALKSFLEPFFENDENDDDLPEIEKLNINKKNDSLNQDELSEPLIKAITIKDVEDYLVELNRYGTFQRDNKLNAIQQLANLPAEFIDQAAIGMAKSHFWHGYDNCHVELIRTLVKFNISQQCILDKLAEYTGTTTRYNRWVFYEATIAQFHFKQINSNDILNLAIQIHKSPVHIPANTCNLLLEIIKTIQLDKKQIEQLAALIQHDNCPYRLCELFIEHIVNDYDEYELVYKIALNSRTARFYAYKALLNYPNLTEKSYPIIAESLIQFIAPLKGLTSEQALNLINLVIKKCAKEQNLIKSLLIALLSTADMRTNAVKLLIEHQFINNEVINTIINSYDRSAETSQSGYPYIMKVATLRALSELHSQFNEQIAIYLRKGFNSSISYVCDTAASSTRMLSQNVNSLRELNRIIECLMLLYFNERNAEYLKILFLVAYNRKMAMVFEDKRIILYGELDPLIIDISPLENFHQIHKFFIEIRNKILKDKKHLIKLPASLIFSENLVNVGLFRTPNIPSVNMLNNPHKQTLRKSL